ncbi:MAG: hypothetical protein R3F29_04660 [Planctomycetota bacterium]
MSFAKWSCFAIVGYTGVAKLLSGAPVGSVAGDIGLPRVLGLVECVLAIGLVRMHRAAWWGCLLLAGCGVAVAILSDKPCGCGGMWSSASRPVHVVMSGLVGFFAAQVLGKASATLPGKPSDPGDGRHVAPSDLL